MLFNMWVTILAYLLQIGKLPSAVRAASRCCRVDRHVIHVVHVCLLSRWAVTLKQQLIMGYIFFFGGKRGVTKIKQVIFGPVASK